MYRTKFTCSALALVLMLPIFQADAAAMRPGDEANHNSLESVDDGSLDEGPMTTGEVSAQADESTQKREAKGLLLVSDASLAITHLFPPSSTREQAVTSRMLRNAAVAPVAGTQAILVQDPFPGPIAVAALSLGGFLLAGMGVVVRDAFKRRKGGAFGAV